METSFQVLQSFVADHPELNDLQSLNWLIGAKTWADTIKHPRLVPSEPRFLSGAEIIKSFKTLSQFSKDLFGARKNIASKNQYWIFQWTSPGVLDRSWTFYVDSIEKKVVLVLSYSSPD